MQNDQATFKQQQQNLQRQTDLYRTHVNALQDFQNAQDSFAAASQSQFGIGKTEPQLH